MMGAHTFGHVSFQNQPRDTSPAVYSVRFPDFPRARLWFCTFGATHPRHNCFNPSSAHLLQPILHGHLWQITQLLVANYTIAEYVLCHTTHTCVTGDAQPQIGAYALQLLRLYLLWPGAGGAKHNRTHWTQPLPQHNLCRAYWSDNGFVDCVSGRQIGYV